jgi:outer membrane immunogenic protein
MKRILSSVAAVALAFGLGSAASAEPFNGPFVGVQAGWNQDDLGTPSTEFGDVAVGRSQDSFSGGVFAGYDYKVSPRVVIGAEAGVQFGADDSIVHDTGTARVTVDPKRSLDLTARAGYLVTDNTLVYARGGYTNARVRTAIDDAAGFRAASENRDGWLVGGGVERAISDNVSARLEYRYSDLSEGDGKFDRHQALFGIAYRF